MKEDRIRTPMLIIFLLSGVSCQRMTDSKEEMELQDENLS
jgi:hypothetical protein